MPPKHPNPLFRRSEPRRLPSPVADLVIIGVLIATAIVLVMLPPFRLARIEVEGTSRLNPAFVAERAQALLARRLLAVLPRGSFFLARESELAAVLTTDLARAVPIASVTVDKRFPQTLRIVVREEPPAAVLVVASGRFLLDQRGIVAGAASEADTSVPALAEANELAFGPGDQAVAPDVVRSLGAVSTAATEHGITITTFRTAEVACPFDFTRPPVSDRAINLNVNGRAGEERGEENAANRNSNRAPTPSPVTQPCDRRHELATTTVFQAVTDRGWVATFDAQQGITESLAALWLALDRKLAGQPLKEIDLRFLPRVYYQ